MRTTIVSLCVLSMVCAAAPAEVRLANIFGDRMVLQRDKPVGVWGWADKGEKVTVRFAGQTKPAMADNRGAWSVKLDAMKASAAGRSLVVQGAGNKVTLKDVLVGEVWLCGGQSNMAWTLRGSRDADMEIPSANFPGIRYFRMPLIARPQPQKDLPAPDPDGREGHWWPCTPEKAENCTAVGYYFARRLHRRLGVPVGLVDTSWGGTMAQHWAPMPVLRGIPEMKPYIETFEAAMKAWSDGGAEAGAKKRYEAEVKAWEKKRTEAKAKGQREPRRPSQKSYTTPAHKRQPAGMFHGMIVPLIGMTFRGVLFYQGENNSFGESWKPFPKTFPAVISSWRKALGDDKLPFGIIQIAGWSNRRSMTYDMNHHTNIVREIQFLTWRRTPHTGLIVTFDTNSSQSIHPGRKVPVGERSARWALAEVYGAKRWGGNEPLEWRGPVYKGMEVQDGKVVIQFEAATARGLVLDQDVDVGFYIAGEDRVFHHARARVRRPDSLEVWSESVPKPVAVRYAVSNLPAGGLMNRRELPAYPFRTDDWPLVPHQSTGEYIVDKKPAGEGK